MHVTLSHSHSLTHSPIPSHTLPLPHTLSHSLTHSPTHTHSHHPSPSIIDPNAKKCRARYGLEQSEKWCGPCRYSVPQPIPAQFLPVNISTVSPSQYQHCVPQPIPALCPPANTSTVSLCHISLSPLSLGRRKKKCVRVNEDEDDRAGRPNDNVMTRVSV